MDKYVDETSTANSGEIYDPIIKILERIQEEYWYTLYIEWR